MTHQGGVEEFQGMPKLEDAKPEEVLREEPPVAIPPAEAMIDLEGMPELGDDGSKECIEEYSADVPLIGESLAQLWFGSTRSTRSTRKRNKRSMIQQTVMQSAYHPR